MATSSSSASPMLVMAAGQTVVTWDCRKESLINTDGDQQQDSSSSLSLKTFHPFAPKNSSSSFHINAGLSPATSSSSSRIADVAWNHNGQVLACCSTSTSAEDQFRNNVLLCSSHSGSLLDSFRHTDSNSNNSKSNKQATATTTPTATTDNDNNNNNHHNSSTTSVITCAAFGGKSRYLCIGDELGDVCLWDLKKQSRVRQFKSKSQKPCLQACLDPTATYVCSLSAEKFTLYNLRQATFAKQWTFSVPTATTSTSNGKSYYSGGSGSVGGREGEESGWQQFRFSPLQPSMLAMGDSTGRIQLYDGLDYDRPQLVCAGGYTSHPSTATSLLSHHASPISGLAFSTQNSKLLANIRVNGILEFVDTSTGEVIHHQQTGGSATALAFQGVSCVVGTESGEVQVYDLRKMMQQFGKAVTNYQMPTREPVTTLEFAPLIKSSNIGSSGSSHNRGARSSRSSSPLPRRPSGSSHNLGIDAVSFDLESRASVTSYPELLQQKVQAPAPSNPSALVAPMNSISFRQSDLDDRKSAAINTAAKNGRTCTSNDEVSATPAASRATSATSGDGMSDKNMSASGRGDPIQQLDRTNNTTKQLTRKEAGNEMAQDGHDANRVASLLLKQPPKNVSPCTVQNKINDNVNNNVRQDISFVPDISTTSFLQNMIQQELQQPMFSLRECMEGAIRNLHVDMIRQFQCQSQEMTSILQQQQDRMDQLLEENQFLRKQNAALLSQHQQQQRTYNGVTNGSK